MWEDGLSPSDINDLLRTRFVRPKVLGRLLDDGEHLVDLDLGHR
jgi:hypothetical protein